MTNKKNLTQGFTLIELSIVLIIIGLIVSGVLAGKHLIQSAELRKTLNQISDYELASNAFYLKYNAFPGDMPNAFAVWGEKCAEVAEKCNGDGDGIIAKDQEPVLMWQHLSLAGLISGTYKGVAATTMDEIAPKGPGGRGYFIVRQGAIYYAPPREQIQEAMFRMNNLLVYVAEEEESEPSVAQPLTPKEAFNLDSKLDDGVANKGRFWTGSKGSKNVVSLTPRGSYETPGACGDATTGAYAMESNEYVCVSGYKAPAFGGGLGLEAMFMKGRLNEEEPVI